MPLNRADFFTALTDFLSAPLTLKTYLAPLGISAHQQANLVCLAQALGAERCLKGRGRGDTPLPALIPLFEDQAALLDSLTLFYLLTHEKNSRKWSATDTSPWRAVRNAITGLGGVHTDYNLSQHVDELLQKKGGHLDWTTNCQRLSALLREQTAALYAKAGLPNETRHDEREGKPSLSDWQASLARINEQLIANGKAPIQRTTALMLATAYDGFFKHPVVWQYAEQRLTEQQLAPRTEVLGRLRHIHHQAAHAIRQHTKVAQLYQFATEQAATHFFDELAILGAAAKYSEDCRGCVTDWLLAYGENLQAALRCHIATDGELTSATVISDYHEHTQTLQASFGRILKQVSRDICFDGAVSMRREVVAAIRDTILPRTRLLTFYTAEARQYQAFINALREGRKIEGELATSGEGNTQAIATVATQLRQFDAELVGHDCLSLRAALRTQVKHLQAQLDELLLMQPITLAPNRLKHDKSERPPKKPTTPEAQLIEAVLAAIEEYELYHRDSILAQAQRPKGHFWCCGGFSYHGKTGLTRANNLRAQLLTVPSDAPLADIWSLIEAGINGSGKRRQSLRTLVALHLLRSPRSAQLASLPTYTHCHTTPNGQIAIFIQEAGRDTRKAGPQLSTQRIFTSFRNALG